MILDFEPNMVAYVSYLGAGVSSPTSEQLVALLNSDKTNPYVAAILGNYTFEQYCQGFLAGTGSIQPGVSNKTAVDYLIGEQLTRWDINSSDDLSNYFGLASDGAVGFGFKNKLWSPGAATFGLDNEAGSEGYPSESIAAIATGYNTKALGNQSISAGYNTKASGNQSVAGGAGEAYEVNGSGADLTSQQNFRQNLVDWRNSTGYDKPNDELRALLPENTSVTKFPLWGHALGNRTVNLGKGNVTAANYSLTLGTANINNGNSSIVTGNQNIVKSGYHHLVTGISNIITENSDVPTNSNLLVGTGNKMLNAFSSAIIGADCVLEQGGYKAVIGLGLKTTVNNQLGKLVIGKYNSQNTNAVFEIGNGTADNARSNAFEVTNTGIARAYGTPTSSNDLITKGYADSHYGGVQLHQHTITTDLTTIVVRSDVSTSFSDFNDVFTYAVGPVRNEYGQTYIAINNELCGCYEYDAETGDINLVSTDMPTIINDVVE